MLNDKVYTFQNAVTTTGNGLELYANRNDQVTFYITGTSSSRTIIFEGSDEDGNWYSAPAFKMPDYTMAYQTTGTAEAWVVDLTKWIKIRAKVSAVAGGTVIVKGKVVNTNG